MWQSVGVILQIFGFATAEIVVALSESLKYSFSAIVNHLKRNKCLANEIEPAVHQEVDTANGIKKNANKDSNKLNSQRIKKIDNEPFRIEFCLVWLLV